MIGIHVQYLSLETMQVKENGEVFVMWNGQLPSPLEQPSFSLEVELRNPEADQNREELFTRETIRIGNTLALLIFIFKTLSRN